MEKRAIGDGKHKKGILHKIAWSWEGFWMTLFMWYGIWGGLLFDFFSWRRGGERGLCGLVIAVHDG